jgi:hypothetical protein
MIQYFRFALFNVSTSKRKTNRFTKDIPSVDCNVPDCIQKQH